MRLSRWPATTQMGPFRAFRLEAQIGADIVPNNIILQEAAHEGIHHQPRHHDDDEADGHVPEELFSLILLADGLVGEVQPAGIREKERREEYREEDATVDEILRQLDEMLAFTVQAIARDDFVRQTTASLLRKREVRQKGHYGRNEREDALKQHGVSVASPLSPHSSFGEKIRLATNEIPFDEYIINYIMFSVSIVKGLVHAGSVYGKTEIGFGVQAAAS